MPATRLEVIAIPDFPDIRPGDRLAELILEYAHLAGLTFVDGDVLCVSSKIVSKAENRFVNLHEVEATQRAHELATITHKSPEMVELVLRESTFISRAVPYVLVVQHKLGFICANAGIDQSNLGADYDNFALLLPENPDKSAAQLRHHVRETIGVEIATVITDTHGRPFRMGNMNIAIGLSGLPAVLDERGHVDRYGRVLKNTITAFADQIASASGLVSGEAGEGQPVTLIRGLSWRGFEASNAQALIRPAEKDLYLKD